MDFFFKIQGSYLRIFSKKGKRSSFEIFRLNPIFNFFFTKMANLRFHTSISNCINFSKKSILHYNTRFSWNFLKKSKVATLGFFQKKAKYQVLSSSGWTPFLKWGVLKYSILLLIFKKNDTQKFGVKIKFESINISRRKL